MRNTMIRCACVLALMASALVAPARVVADAAEDNARAAAAAERVARERAEAAAKAAEVAAQKAKADAIAADQARAAVAAEKNRAAADLRAGQGIKVTKRLRKEVEGKPGEFEVVTQEQLLHPGQTAIIVCDVWDLHHCLNAVRREEEMVPRMNEVITKARSQGVLIIHAPSGCMDTYKDHPGRKLAQSAPKASNLPKDIASWCYKIPSEEKGKYPIDQSDGGEDDDPKEHAEWQKKLADMGRNPKAPWKKQHDGIKIHDGDAISDSGVEIWNLLEHRAVRNVILVGVHTNMCVLGRPFGLRRMASNGKNTMLMRDMTDTMYNPKMPPFVSHFEGTRLIIEHIEKYVCSTITSDQFIGGEPFRFKGDDAK